MKGGPHPDCDDESACPFALLFCVNGIVREAQSRFDSILDVKRIITSTGINLTGL